MPDTGIGKKNCIFCGQFVRNPCHDLGAESAAANCMHYKGPYKTPGSLDWALFRALEAHYPAAIGAPERWRLVAAMMGALITIRNNV